MNKIVFYGSGNISQAILSGLISSGYDKNLIEFVDRNKINSQRAKKLGAKKTKLERIDSKSIINSICPKKDVDGFHPENAGLLSIGSPRFIPCTPKGVMRIFEYYKISLSGKHVVVLGRSNIVGRPMSILTSLKTKGANSTTTLCHSGSADIEKFTKIADVIIVALGIPNYLKKDMIRKDAILIDVGINRINDNSEKGYKLCGDVFWDEVTTKAKAITPVPGGVGPMTIAMLVENTVEAAENTLK